MAGGENYCLRLNQFESNIRTTWQQLQIDKDFCDVILACNGGQIPSHKIILSHSSPILKNILKQNLNQNPVIYLRGVKYKYLANLVSFMYQGEVTVAEEDLKNFLDVAEDLKIRGLPTENREFLSPIDELPKIMDEVLPCNSNEKLHKNLDDEPVELYSLEHSSKGKHEIQKPTGGNRNAHESIKSSASQNFEYSDLLNVEHEVLKVNKKQLNTQELVSIVDKQITYNMFNKQYNNSNQLSRHKASAHEEVEYSCDQCDVRSFTSSGSLRTHKAISHEEVGYPCNQCHVSPFTTSGDLKSHKDLAHKGFRYPCHQCDRSFNDSRSVRKHKASVHEGVRFECNICPYKATQKGHLKIHTKNVHKI